MNQARGMNRPTRVDSDEIIKSARRRARAADSRRRALVGDGSALPTDGGLALQPLVDPVEELRPEVTPTSAPGRQRKTVPVAAPRKAPAARPVEMPRTPFVLSVIALIAVGIVGLLVLNTAINENAYTLQDLHNGQTTLDSTEERLTDEIAELSAPGNLAAAAERLGLVEATDITYLRLPDGKELKMPTPGGN